MEFVADGYAEENQYKPSDEESESLIIWPQ